jgi:hypothetical protein
MQVCGKGGRDFFYESDVHLPQPPKKSSYLLHLRSSLFLFYFYLFIDFLSRFWAFRKTRGVQKHDKNFFFVQTRQKSIWAHHKNVAFSSSVPPPPSLGCFARFFLIAFLGVS